MGHVTDRPGLRAMLLAAALALGCEGSAVVGTGVEGGVDASASDIGPQCAAGESICGGACADTRSNPLHCGACGSACPAGSACVAGSCRVACPSPQVPCPGGDGGATVCTLTDTDRGNCGACGNRCPAGQVCSMGACATECAPPLAVCGAAGGPRSCADTSRDAMNCGACGRACAPGQACVMSACVTSCPAGQSVCGGGDGGVGVCADLQSDAMHCGACGNACAAGRACVAGSCTTVCAAGFTSCQGGCRDLQTDRAHCGACGNACSPGEVCAAGSCAVSCPSGQAVCSGSCRDLQTDRAHCGACGNACPAGQLCVAGACATVCAGGLTSCGGVCRDLQSDRAHCGACDRACGQGLVCSAGACVTSCPQGQSVCNGACVVTATDPAHCGACGNACPARPGATAVCAGGTCGFVCAAGLADCDLRADNGCEARPATDPNHCGRCGNVCAARPNAPASCAAGVCATSCSAGFADCDNNPANGCEVDLRSSVTHCGRCGNACAGGANATALCANTVCAVSCAAGFADCDNSPANGCEVDTRSSNAHCGGCGNVCAAGTSCVAGQCSAATCRRGATLLSRSPSGSEVLCDDPLDATCEQDFESLCPANWHLCTLREHNARNTGWSYVPSSRTLGVIYCRPGSSGAGHLTFPDAPQSDSLPMSTAVPFNCYYGSSRPSCTAGYGCNEQPSHALCCAPNPLCGNGRVDAPEEDCDDANANDADDCLSTCTWRVPTEHGYRGTNC